MNEDGTYDIVIKLASTCCQPDEVGGDGVVFTFKIQNPAIPPPHVVPTVGAHGINVVETSMREDVGKKRPMYLVKTGLKQALIAQSTNLPCQTNTITVTLEGTKILEACHAHITISGLLATVHTSSTISLLEDSTTSAASVGTSADWGNGLLILDVISFPADTPVSFSFEVKNPASETEPSDVSIKIDTTEELFWSPQWQLQEGELMASQMMKMPARTNLRPITVMSASFVESVSMLVGDVTQTSPYPSKSNVITVSLRASVPLNTHCTVMVTIGPFHGACVSDDLESFEVLGGLALGSNSTVPRTWDPTSNMIKIAVKADAIAYTEGDADQHLLHFKFAVKNPVTAQTSPEIYAQASGIEMETAEMARNLNEITPADITSGEPIDAMPMHVRGLLIPNRFTTRNIGQSSAEPGAANVITVTIATNIPLPATNPATRVTISGLSGAEYGASSMPPKFNVTWNGDKNSIYLDTKVDTEAGEEIMMSFNFTNPESPQTSPRVYIEASGIAIAPMAMEADIHTRIMTIDDDGETMEANPGLAAPLTVLRGKLYARSVHQKSGGEKPGSENTLTFSFRSTVALKSATSHVALLINGLNGMRLAEGSRSGVPVVKVTKGGADALVTNTSCAFDDEAAHAHSGCSACEHAMRCPYLDGATPDASKLMIGIKEVLADTEIEFTVTFTNAHEAQDCQELTLETVSCDPDYDFPPGMLQVKDEFKMTYQCPLTIVPTTPFTTKKVCQSAACTGAVNTITISLQPKFALTGAKNSEVTIRGLQGSVTRDSMVTLLSGAPVFEAKARWVQSSGMLILRVAPTSTLASDNVTVVSFDLMNPKYKQPAPERIEVMASGDFQLSAVCMDTCDGEAAPMHITPAKFAKAAIGSSSSVGGQDNTVTVTLQPQCTVLCDSRHSIVTVEGLVGTSTHDTIALPVTMIKGSAGLFMSADEISLSFSSSCKLEDSKVLMHGVSVDPTGVMLFFSAGECSGRYTKIEAFDESSGCATLFLNATANTWSDGNSACDLGVVGSVTVSQRGSGFKSGNFTVGAETGSGLTGECVVDEHGGVESIIVKTGGKGYSHDTKVRCPRACECTSAPSCACGARVEDYGQYSVVSLAETDPMVTSVCAWDQIAGRLTCAVQGCAKSMEETVFSVSLTNAPINQPVQTVNVMASGSIAIPAQAMEGSVMNIKTKSPGHVAVKMSVLVHTSAWDGISPAAPDSDGNELREAVADAAGVELSKVEVEIEEIESVTAFTRSSSYLQAADLERHLLKCDVTVEADDVEVATFIASGMTSERIKASLGSTSIDIEVPEEYRASVEETAATSVTAVCICKQANLTESNDGNSCTCTSSLTGMPTSNTTSFSLSAEVQCNSLAEISSFKIGGQQMKSSVMQSPNSCNDMCSEYHKVLENLDVSTLVESGSLDVEIEAKGLEQDYCGAGDAFKAILVVSY